MALKFEVFYDTENDLVKVLFDRKTQAVLSCVADQIQTFTNGRDLTVVCRQLGVRTSEKPLLGLTVLKRIAAQNKGYFIIPSQDMSLAFDLVCWFFSETSRKLASACRLSSSVVILAKVTPVLIPLRFLPSLTEISDQGKLTPGGAKSVQKLLSTTSCPHLFVFRAFQLWRELSRLSINSQEFRGLVQLLDVSSTLFRQAIEKTNKPNVAGKRSIRRYE